MKHSMILALAAITLAGCQQEPTAVAPVRTPSFSAVSANSSVKMVSSTSVPVSTSLFVPCARAGLGEDVGIRGAVLADSKLTLSGSGSGTALIRVQPQNLAALGFTSGTRYQATGNTQVRVPFSGLPISGSTATIITFRGPGPHNDFQLNGTLQYSIDANGQLTATLINPTVVCIK